MSIQRKANAVWNGNLKEGNGTISAPSGVLNHTPFSFCTRFENEPGTNPEELIAAAHAACFSMAFANFLSEQGHAVESIATEATVVMEVPTVQSIRLVTRGKVAGLDQAEFADLAEQAEKKCPISNLLRGGAEISVEATLD